MLNLKNLLRTIIYFALYCALKNWECCAIFCFFTYKRIPSSDCSVTKGPKRDLINEPESEVKRGWKWAVEPGRQILDNGRIVKIGDPYQTEK